MRSDDLEHYSVINNEESVARLAFDLDQNNEPHFSWHNKFSFGPLYYQQQVGDNFFKARQISQTGKTPKAPSVMTVANDGKRFMFWMAKNEAEDGEPYRLYGTYTTTESSDFSNDGNEFFANLEIQRDVVTHHRLIECDVTPEAPVCGVDGVDYQNECLARKAGTEVAKEGICYVEPPEVKISDGIDPILSIDFENGIADSSQNNFQVNASASVEETAINNVGKFHNIDIKRIEDKVANVAPVEGVLKSDNNSLAVSAWIYQLIEDDRDQEIIFTESIAMYVDQHKRLKCKLLDTIITSYDIDTEYKWNHVACSYDGTTLAMFANGKEIASKQVTADITSQVFKPRFGPKFIGYIDDITITRTPLTEATATQMYNQKIQSLTSTLLPTINNAPQVTQSHSFDGQEIGMNAKGIRYSQRAIKNMSLELYENTQMQIPFPSNISHNNFSYSAWVYADNNITNRTGRIMSFDEQSALQIDKRYTVKGSSRKVYFNKNNLSGIISAPNTDGFPDNEWYHVLVSVNNGEAEIFVDGVSYNKNAITLSPFSTINIGGGFRGNLDELEFYNGAVTPTQAQEIYAHRKAETLRDNMIQEFTEIQSPLKFQLQLKEHKDSSSARPSAYFRKLTLDNIYNILQVGNGYRKTGSVYAFATFPKHFLKDKKVVFNWKSNNTAKSSRYKTRYYAQLLDGIYDASSTTDFPNQSPRAKKGYGNIITTFASLENTQPQQIVVKDIPWNSGSENDATLMFHAYNTNTRYNSTDMRIYDVQILDKNNKVVAIWDKEGQVTMSTTSTQNDYGVSGDTHDDFTKLTEPTKVAELKFDQEHGRYSTYITDSSGFKNNGLYETATKPGYDSSKKAITFNGNQHFTIANSSTTQFDNNSFSISMWAKTNQFDQLADIIVKNQDNQNGSIVIRQGSQNSGSQLWAQMYQDDSNFVESEPIENIFNRDKWRHITVVYNKASNKLEVYVNGQLKSETTITGNPKFSSNADWYIAKGEKSGNNWNGSIADMQMFNYELKQNSITETFSQEKNQYIQDPPYSDTPIVHVDANSTDLVNFDGTTGWMEFDDSALKTKFSISTWIKTSDITKNQSIVSKHDYDGNDFLNLGIYNQKLYFELENNSINAGELSNDAWHHIAATTVSSGDIYIMRLYLDGQKIAEKEITREVFDFEGKPWSIGQDWDEEEQSDFFIGEIGSLSIFNKIFGSDSNITELFDAGKYTYFPELLNDIKLQIRTTSNGYNGYETNMIIDQPENSVLRVQTDKAQSGTAYILLSAPKSVLNGNKLKMTYTTGPKQSPRWRYTRQYLYTYDGAYDVSNNDDFSIIRKLNGVDRVYYQLRKKGLGYLYNIGSMYNGQTNKVIDTKLNAHKGTLGMTTFMIYAKDQWNDTYVDFTIHELQVVDTAGNIIFDFQPGQEIDWIVNDAYEQIGTISQ
jgi:hypothetical protein